MDVRPEKALVLRQGKEQSVFPGEVEVGEMIMVKPGERIPLDGLLQEEYALFDTSALTGESLPRTINRRGIGRNDRLWSGDKIESD